VRVRLDKRIPLQAGLGGGSSDAAATLMALSKLWRVKVSDARLARMAARLGADVPFFLHGGTAFGVGRGDRLELMDDVPAAWVVLAFPDFGVSSKDAPEEEFLPPSSAWRMPSGFRRRGDIRNDLETPVAERYPEIAEIVGALRRVGARHAAMSGSGSAVFGLFDARQDARAAASALATATRRTIVTRTLSRAQFQRRSRPSRP
jgi:4-diphosphocytidyl-2-C-methyl-D-erythritol kinase